MKKLLLSFMLVLAALIAAPETRAQGYSAYGVDYLLTGGTNIVAAATTATYNLGIGCFRQNTVNIGVSFSATGTNSSTITLKFSDSNDGTTWFTNNPAYTIVMTAADTGTVTTQTNLNVGAVGQIRLQSIQNANATVPLTNVLVNFSTKR